MTYTIWAWVGRCLYTFFILHLPVFHCLIQTDRHTKRKSVTIGSEPAPPFHSFDSSSIFRLGVQKADREAGGKQSLHFTSKPTQTYIPHLFVTNLFCQIIHRPVSCTYQEGLGGGEKRGRRKGKERKGNNRKGDWLKGQNSIQHCTSI